MQKKLFQRLLGLERQIDSIDEGKKLIIEHLKSSSHSCMLIFDDVLDDVDQLDALLPDEFKYAFLSNCLILITSRDKYVLLRSRIKDSYIYKSSGLIENTPLSSSTAMLFASRIHSPVFNIC